MAVPFIGDKIKVLIVEDHAIVREGLKLLLEFEGGIEVIGEVEDGISCLEFLKSNPNPDIIFMDIRLPGISGIETTRAVTEKYSNIQVIMLTMYKHDHYVKDAIRSGASGYVLKNGGREELIKTINMVIDPQSSAEPVIDSKIKVFADREEPGIKDESEHGAPFTKRELEILECLIQGDTNRLISERLFISEQTVKTHLKNIFSKLNVNSKSQAVVRAIQKNIINPYVT